MKIVPAPLEPTLEAFSRQMDRLLPYYKRFSIDIQDGKAVSTKSLQLSEVTSFVEDHHADLQDVIFDFDLMTNDYELALNQIEQLKKHVRVGTIVILKSVLAMRPLPMRDTMSIGISLDPQDTVDDLVNQYNLKSIPCIQIMTIHAGPQGQSLMADMLNKIDHLRELDYRSLIYIDGGLNKDTLPVVLARRSLPNFACVGSYLTKCSDDELKERVIYLRSTEE